MRFFSFFCLILIFTMFMNNETQAKEKNKDKKIFSVNCVNWKEYPYCPEVEVEMTAKKNSLHLCFNVKEKCIRAEVTEINGPVHTDSCVEFFISPFSDGNYYNFEFNCIGVTHVEYGPNRENRKNLPEKWVKKIKTNSSLGNKSFSSKEGDFSWSLNVIIPSECFIHDDIESFKNLNASANFYKCGDKTSDPHFISWKPIKTPSPDFHRYDFLYKLKF